MQSKEVAESSNGIELAYKTNQKTQIEREKSSFKFFWQNRSMSSAKGASKVTGPSENLK